MPLARAVVSTRDLRIAQIDFTNFAPRLGLVWRPVESLAAYLSMARGFRAPEVTELYRLQRQQSVADLDSERADAVELGLRWRGASAGFDLAAFTMDKQNVILRDSAGFNVSGGRTRHRGLEYDLDWAIRERMDDCRQWNRGPP